MKTENKNIGTYGEQLATEYLKKNKHIILTNNFRIKKGEIDIISRVEDIIVFTEVKTRYNRLYGVPLEGVTFSKQNTIKLIASYFIYKYSLYNCNVRFDVVEVNLNYYDEGYRINHINDAFR